MRNGNVTHCCKCNVSETLKKTKITEYRIHSYTSLFMLYFLCSNLINFDKKTNFIKCDQSLLKCDRSQIDFCSLWENQSEQLSQKKEQRA